MKYLPITSKSALNKLKSPYLPYHYDLNIYRGCSHHCQYCYAQYSHQYLNQDQFFNTIYIKDNILEVLEKELQKKTWAKKPINLGGVTDSYQSIEAQQKFMPRLLWLFIKYQNPLIISTKSALILRDIELFVKLAQVADVHINCSITTFDESLRHKIEPYSSTSAERLNVLKEFKNTNTKRLKVGVLMMPILPFLTDSTENISQVFAAVQTVPVDYLIPGLLNLKGRTKTHFLKFIKEEFPDKLPAYLNTYQGAFASAGYKTKFYQQLEKLKNKYQIRNPRFDFHGEQQLDLFNG